MRPASTSIAVVVAIVVFVGAFGVFRPDQAQRYIVDGRRAAELVDDTTFPAGQTELASVGQPFRARRLDHLQHRSPARPRWSPVEQLRSWWPTDPDDLVLILGDCDDGDPCYEFCTDVSRAAAAECRRRRAPAPPGRRIPPGRRHLSSWFHRDHQPTGMISGASRCCTH